MNVRSILSAVSTLTLAATSLVGLSATAASAGAPTQTYQVSLTFNYGAPNIPSSAQLPSGADAAAAIFSADRVF